MSKFSDEVLWQLFLTGPVWDGDLASKTGRDELVDAGYVVRASGWQTLTETGLRIAIEKGLAPRKNSFASRRLSPWPTNETLKESGLEIGAAFAALALGLIAATFAWLPTARGADLGVKAPPLPYVTNYQWTGLWIGAYLGGAANTTNPTVTDGTAAVDVGAAPKGFLGGVNAGLNYQASPLFVLGLYVEQDFANITGSGNMLGAFSVTNATNYLGAAGLRAGYLLNPSSLLYAKGGFAWVGAKPDFSAVGTSKGISDTSAGWQIGGGLEHRLGANWSIKIEYDHTQAGDKQIIIPIDGGVLTSVNKFGIDKAVVGINYWF